MSWTQIGIVLIQEAFSAAKSWITSKPTDKQPEEGVVNSSQRDIAIASESHMAASREGKIAARMAKEQKEKKP